jgi:hypothetical protein
MPQLVQTIPLPIIRFKGIQHRQLKSRSAKEKTFHNGTHDARLTNGNAKEDTDTHDASHRIIKGNPTHLRGFQDPRMIERIALLEAIEGNIAYRKRCRGPISINAWARQRTDVETSFTSTKLMLVSAKVSVAKSMIGKVMIECEDPIDTNVLAPHLQLKK